MKREYKPLNMFSRQSDELKKLIAEHPDYQIVVLTDTDVVFDDSYSSWYAPDISFYLGELLDCEQSVNQEIVYTDRDFFREDLENYFADIEELNGLSDEDFNKFVDAEMKKYEPYWKKVIVIHGSL